MLDEKFNAVVSELGEMVCSCIKGFGEFGAEFSIQVHAKLLGNSQCPCFGRQKVTDESSCSSQMLFSEVRRVNESDQVPRGVGKRHARLQCRGNDSEMGRAVAEER